MADAAKPNRSAAGIRWTALVWIGIAGLVLVALLWSANVGRAISAGADRRNQIDLGIVASGLEQYGGTIASLAQANFLPGRITALRPDERDHQEGWRYRVWVRHPTLDEFKLVYRITSPEECDGIRDRIIAREGPLPFVANYYGGNDTFLKLVGKFALALPFSVDTLQGLDAMQADALGTYVRNITGREPAETLGTTSVVCYAAGIPLGRLLVPERSGTGFTTILVLDSRRDIVAQVGPERLPLTSFDGVAPETSVLVQLAAASLGKASPAPQKRSAIDSLEPVPVDIGGQNYIAYIRQLRAPADFTACRANAPPTTAATPAPAVAAAPSAAAASAPAASTAPARNGCLIVGLVPRKTLWRQVLSLPPVIGIVLGLGTIMLVTLVPALRLVLLGPGEAIGRAEAVAVALGIPAFASIATLSVLFATDLGVARQHAHHVAARLAQTAAAATAAELNEAAATVRRMAQSTGYRDAAAAPAGKVPPAQPMPQQLAGPALCPAWPGSGLPKADGATLFGQDGEQLAGTRMVACRGLLGGRSNVSARPYFQRLRQREAGSGGWTSAAPEYDYVRSMQDGVAKAVIAMPLQQPNTRPDRPDRAHGYLVGSSVLDALVAPVLPPPFSLIVVDSRSDLLPILVHPVPGRASGEQLGASVPRLEALQTQLRGLFTNIAPTAAGDADALPHADFTAFYDGQERRFIGAPVIGTRWVALVSYAESDVDALATTSAMFALRLWAAFSLVSVALWIGWLVATRRRGWPRLWPQTELSPHYRDLTRTFLMLAAAGLLLVLVVPPRAGLGLGLGLAVLIGLGVRLGAAVLLHRRLPTRRRPGAGARPLSPETEWRYSRMFAALVLCLSVVPMTAFWREGRLHAVEQMRQDVLVALTGPGGSIAVNAGVFNRLRWAMDIPLAPPPAARQGVTAAPGHYGVFAASTSAEAAPEAAFFSPFIDAWLDRPPLTTALRCPEPTAAPRVAAGAASRPTEVGNVVLCGDARAWGINLYLPGLFRGAAPLERLEVLFPALLFAAALAALAWGLTARVLTALIGFGIPLEAFRTPPLCVRDLWEKTPARHVPERYLSLNRKSLLVNAPYIIIPMLKQSGRIVRRFNIADPGTLSPSNPGLIRDGEILVFTGLELVLADRTRRLEALALLERAAAGLAALGVKTRSRLLILSETAPMERILDAFERDQDREQTDAARENLRWSRLFEDFATFGFAPNRMTGGRHLEARLRDQNVSDDEREGVLAVLDEARWLPARVVNGAIGQEVIFADKYLERAVVPVSEVVYQAHYEPELIKWAKARRFPGAEAARAHFRSQIIEHYQKVWSSSTHGEHLVLYHLAHGRFVNIGAALAFASLVRRGLVVLDPEPRLLNESFAMFIRQAEKLDTIKTWQDELPRGTWVRARLPLLLTVMVAIALLAAVMALSGEDSGSLLPVLAAGVPALLAALQRALARQ